MRNDYLGKLKRMNGSGRLFFELIKTIPEIVHTCTGYDDFHDVAFDV